MRKYGFDNDFGTSFSHGIRFLEFPQFDYGQEIVESKLIPGRAGTLSVRTGKYTDTTIKCVLEFVSEEVEDFGEKLDTIKKWLMKSKSISFTDNEDNFWVVKKVDLNEIKRKYGFFGNVTVVFTCETFSYLKAGNYELPIEGVKKLYNKGVFSQPIYKITGEGICTLSVNDKTMTANVSGNIIIDTELMLAYREDGTSQNTAVKGNYEDLYLQEGDNVITVSEGFECKVIPRWRCL